MRKVLVGGLIVLAAVFAVALLVHPGTARAEEGEKPPVDCAAKCEVQAKRVLAACLRDGGREERCQKRADDAKAECVRACRRAVQPPPGPVEPAPRACEVRCEKYGKAIFEACLLLPIGPTREQCQRRQQEAVRICIAKTCPPKEQPRKEPPDPKACATRCETAAREIYRKCVAGSTSPTPDECGQKARRWLQNCIEKNCKPASVRPNPDPGKEPGACRTQCRERVGAWRAECLAQPGATEERCDRAAAKKLAACVENCP